MTDTTQAIRDALAAGKASPYGIVFTDGGWFVFNDACNPEAITALLAELDAARAGIEAAVLAERDRCAALCESISAEDGIGSYKHEDDYAVGAVNALIRTAIEIREGVKS